MILIPSCLFSFEARFRSFATLALQVLFSVVVCAQTTISTGSIRGTITDPTGAVVAGAKVTVTDKATGQVITTTTTSSGTYTSGSLIPGNYAVQVEAKGFKTLDAAIPILVGVTTAGNFKLQLGEASQIVEVLASDLQVNTEQAAVQGVLNNEQIENLPVNGRNFLELAQLEPGVQIQDGGNFDPTRKGFLQFPSAGSSAARRGSKSMESIQATRRWARLLKIYPWERSRNFSSESRCWIFPPS